MSTDITIDTAINDYPAYPVYGSYYYPLNNGWDVAPIGIEQPLIHISNHTEVTDQIYIPYIGPAETADYELWSLRKLRKAAAAIQIQIEIKEKEEREMNMSEEEKDMDDVFDMI